MQGNFFMAIRLDNSFFLDMAPDAAWALLNDVERIAPCVPGAQLTDVAGETYGGKVKVKIGPITAEYKGKATITTRDVAARRLTLTGKGQDVRGQGTAGADLEMLVTPEGAGSRVTLGTDLAITGKVAQLGKGVMQDVSGRLVDQFVANLKALAPAAPEAPVDAPITPTPAEPAIAAAPRLIDAPEAEPVDLVKLGGGALFSRELLVGSWMVAVLILLVLILLRL